MHSSDHNIGNTEFYFLIGLLSLCICNPDSKISSLTPILLGILSSHAINKTYFLVKNDKKLDNITIEDDMHLSSVDGKAFVTGFFFGASASLLYGNPLLTFFSTLFASCIVRHQGYVPIYELRKKSDERQYKIPADSGIIITKVEATKVSTSYMAPLM